MLYLIQPFTNYSIKYYLGIFVAAFFYSLNNYKIYNMATLINDLETYISDDSIEKPITHKQVKFSKSDDIESDNDMYISFEIYESFNNIKNNLKKMSLKKILVFSFIIFIVSNNYIKQYVLDNLHINNKLIQTVLTILISLFIYIFF